MLSEQFDAGQAGFRVGYQDASQFNREYKRQFGEPPSRDVGHLLSLSELSVRN
jgi:AraC-like DNA-binding protein